MFNFLTKKIPPTNVIPAKAGIHKSTTTIELQNLDCPSCAVDIDLTLEELPGVISSKTNYTKSELKISFDSKKIKLAQINQKLTDLGYLK